MPAPLPAARWGHWAPAGHRPDHGRAAFRQPCRAASASEVRAEGHLLDFNLSGVGLALRVAGSIHVAYRSENLRRKRPALNFGGYWPRCGRAKGDFEHPDEDDSEASTFSANPFANAIFSFDGRPATPGGGSSWDAALAWIEEDDGPAAIIETRQPAADTAEAILDELGLTENLTHEELNQARRLYMWRNHPDRHRRSAAGTARRGGWRSPICWSTEPRRVLSAADARKNSSPPRQTFTSR